MPTRSELVFSFGFELVFAAIGYLVGGKQAAWIALLVGVLLMAVAVRFKHAIEGKPQSSKSAAARTGRIERKDWLDLERRFQEVGARHVQQRRRLFISKDFTNHYIVRTDPWDDVVIRELTALCINAGQLLSASAIYSTLPKVVALKSDPLQRWSWYLRTEGESKLHGFVIDHIAHTSARACLKLAAYEATTTP